jgi:hypothetical protein
METCFKFAIEVLLEGVEAGGVKEQGDVVWIGGGSVSEIPRGRGVGGETFLGGGGKSRSNFSDDLVEASGSIGFAERVADMKPVTGGPDGNL